MGNTWETQWKSMRPFSLSHPLTNPFKKNDVDVAVFLGQKCGTCPQVMCEVLKIPSSKGVDFLQFNRLARHSMAWKISDIYIFFPHFWIYLSVHFFGFAWIFPIARFKYRMASAFLMVMNSPASEKGDF
jgi:hypothetical protein